MEEGYKRVDGVLKSNVKARNEHIRRNGSRGINGRYSLYDGFFSPHIGEAVELYTYAPRSLTKDKSIVDFTHDTTTRYGKEIYEKYTKGIPEITFFGLDDAINADLHKVEKYVGLYVNPKNGKINVDLGENAVIYHDGFTNETPKSDSERIFTGNENYEKLSTFFTNGEPYINTTRSVDKTILILTNGKYDGKDAYGVEQYTNIKSMTGKHIKKIYSEADTVSEVGTSIHVDEGEVISEFDEFEHQIDGQNNLLKKTDKLLNSHKIRTMVGRFVTSNDDGYNDYHDSFDSAKIRGLGRGKGRTLLKNGVKSGADIPYTNGYYNPFCRSWTYHHEYSKFSDTIRHNFSDEGKDYYKINRAYRTRFPDKYGGNSSELAQYGDEYLKRNTILQDNGLIRITPKNEEDPGNSKLKKYMFSLENLAWSDGSSMNETNLSKSQKGPYGGRIMWFPPYDLKFSENINVKWNQNTFIGRGEDVYTYTNTERTGNLSFTLLIDHPVIVNSYNNGKYNGKAPDYNIEDDILRFFAGCEIQDPDDVDKIKPPKPYPFDITESTWTEKEKIEQDVNELIENGQIATDTYKVSFKVYFPNNYSGRHENMLSGKTNTSRYEELRESPAFIDENWYHYILMGKGAKLPGNNGPYGNGYEIVDHGISMDSGGTLLKESEYGYKCAGIKQDADWMKYNVNLEGTGKHTFLYLTDADLYQHAIGKNGYKDEKSHELNGFKDNGTPFNISHECTFAEIVSAFGVKNLKGKSYEEYFSGKFDENRLNEIKHCIFKNHKDGEKIIPESVVYYGNASSQDPTNTIELAKRRAETLKHFVKNVLYKNESPNNNVFNVKITSEKDEKNKEKDGSKGKSNQEYVAKTHRYAEVTFIFKVVKTKEVSTDKDKNDNGNRNNTPIITKYLLKETDTFTYDFEEDPVNRRYDDEYRFFNTLKTTDPVLFRNIKEKIKYFSPAYHSLSPEGFNARLTFLQQCTRQGHTMSTSDSQRYGATSSNLAFGKMPICVLRIGDFIHTRILIRSISIDYSNGGHMQWDLNPEGAGVQPMFANVKLNIVILGGQSLDGPISRLQNAVTFDYYANAGVYDDRADRIYVDDQGKTEYKHIFEPYSSDNIVTKSNIVEKMYKENQEALNKTPAAQVTRQVTDDKRTSSEKDGE